MLDKSKCLDWDIAQKILLQVLNGLKLSILCACQVEGLLRDQRDEAINDAQSIIERQSIVHTSHPAYFDMTKALHSIIAGLRQPLAETEISIQSSRAVEILNKLSRLYRIQLHTKRNCE